MDGGALLIKALGGGWTVSELPNSQTIKTGSSRYKSHSPRGGFLQVAVSEASPRPFESTTCRGMGASDTALRPVGT
jgi:hypothetical protein